MTDKQRKWQTEELAATFLKGVRGAIPQAGLQLDTYFVENLYNFHQQKDPAISRGNVARAYYDRSDKEENILAPVEFQCEWLRQIGFTDVDCFFKVFELALFGGRKAPTLPIFLCNMA